MFFDIFEKLDLLIVLCFSLLNFSFSLLSLKIKPYENIIGFSFIIPFLAAATSFIFVSQSSIPSFISLSELVTIFFMLLVLLFKPSKTISIILYCAALLIPLALTIPFLYMNTIPESIAIKSYSILAIIIVSLIVLFILRNESSNKKLLIAAFIGIIVLGLSTYMLKTYPYKIILLVEKLFIYSMFLKFIKNLKHIPEPVAINKVRKLEIKPEPHNVEIKSTVEHPNNLIDITNIDPLTKALNRDSILGKIEKEIASNKLKSFSILLIDVTNFKEINNSLGRAGGDKYLRNLVIIAKSLLRSGDIIGRLENDLFLALLPGSTPLQVKLVSERFQKKASEAQINISIGIASFPGDGHSLLELLNYVKKSLVEAKKHKGNNRFI